MGGIGTHNSKIAQEHSPSVEYATGFNPTSVFVMTLIQAGDVHNFKSTNKYDFSFMVMELYN